MSPESFRQQSSLIEPALALARCVEWNWYDDRAVVLYPCRERVPSRSEQRAQAHAQTFPPLEFELKREGAKRTPIYIEGSRPMKTEFLRAALGALRLHTFHRVH